MKLSLYFLRHGQSIYQSRKIISGIHELGLSGIGKIQSHEIAEQIKSVKFDYIYSSDLKRCAETTELVIKKLENKPSKNNIFFTELVREKDYGDDKLKFYTEQQFFNNSIDVRNQKVPNGESWQDLSNRVQIFFNLLLIVHFQDNKAINDFHASFEEYRKCVNVNEKANQFQYLNQLKQTLQLFRLQMAQNYELLQNRTLNRNILIVTHGGFICELLIYLKHRKAKNFFELISIPANASHENLSNQMYAKNGALLHLDVSLDKSKIEWECEILVKNGCFSQSKPFIGWKEK